MKTSPASPATTGATTGTKSAGAARRRIAGDRRRLIDLTPAEDHEQHQQIEDAESVEDVEVADRAEVLSSRDVPLAVPAEDDEDTEEQPAPARDAAAGVRRRPRWVVAALVMCLVAVLAACVLATVTTRAADADVRAGDSALAAAKASAATILSYDYRHLDADFGQAAALTTGSFRTDYQATTAKAVRQLATQTQAVVVAKVVAGGVVSSTTDRATVLLFVNQTTTSNRLSAAKTDLNRVQMTLTRSGSRWLVSGLKAL
jgi:Mce-associated membrane protein